MWSVLPAPVHAAVWIVCALVLIALIGANVPFAPPIPVRPPDERDSSAYLDAMAALMRRARASRAAVATFANDARRRTLRRSRSQHQYAVDALTALERSARPSDKDLLSAALLDYELRKERA
jgi:hypothetical protein